MAVIDFFLGQAIKNKYGGDLALDGEKWEKRFELKEERKVALYNWL